MTTARVEQDENGKYFVGPRHLGLFTYKSKNDLLVRSMAQAINQAHQRGRDELARELRMLLGVPKEDD